jgi:AcrR family transcriptional regulator
MKNPSPLPFVSPAPSLEHRILRRKTPIQDRARVTDEALLQATLQVLLRDGYDRLTTTRVAARAGVSVGTLYQYHADKRSLVTALKVRYFGLMVQAVAAALADPTPADLPAILRRALSALIRVKREHLDLTRALRAPMAEPDGQSFQRETLAHFGAALEPYLRRAGLPDPARRTTLLIAALDGALTYAVHQSPDWLSDDAFLDDLVALAVGFLRQVVPD